MKKALPHDKEKMEQFAVEKFIQGFSHSELSQLIREEFGKVTDVQVTAALSAATKNIRKNTLLDLDKIIPQHVELYEQIYKELDELYCMQGKLKALRQKEKLLGLLKENSTIDIYNEVNIEIEQETPYDLGKLDSRETKRLQTYLTKVL